MRKLKCLQSPGVSVSEVLEEFNERAAEFGITAESDIISVQSAPLTRPVKIATATGTVNGTIEVTIFYWADEDEED